MEFSLHIVICGKSLLLTTLTHCLRAQPGIAVTQIDHVIRSAASALQR